MALSDCPKCWSTPCNCDYMYIKMGPAGRQKIAAAILGAMSEEERQAVLERYAKSTQDAVDAGTTVPEEYEIRALEVLHHKDDDNAVEAFMDALSNARDDENVCIEWRMYEWITTASRDQAARIIGDAATHSPSSAETLYGLRAIDVLHLSNDEDGVRRLMDFLNRAESEHLLVGWRFVRPVATVSRRGAESRMFTTIPEEAPHERTTRTPQARRSPADSPTL